MMQTWAEQRDNQAAVLEYIAAEHRSPVEAVVGSWWTWCICAGVMLTVAVRTAW